MNKVKFLKILLFLNILISIGYGQLISLPPAPVLSPEGYQLILDFEVGSGETYYNKFLKRLSWPGAFSGITAGIGWDAGYNSREVLLHDWQKLPPQDLNRFADTAGVTGQKAKAILPSVRDIMIEWNLASEVFNQTTLTKFYQLSKRTFPGFENLEPNAQAAIVSLIFNRGASLIGPRRGEMRKIKELIPKKDYQGIAVQIRKMKKIWNGTDIEAGMHRRREAEARLIESCK